MRCVLAIYLKIISALIAWIFAFDQVSWADPQRQSLAPSSELDDTRIVRSIHRDGKALAITQRAGTKMAALDQLARSHITQGEVVGYGLTKRTESNLTIVVDFIAPEKILVIDQLQNRNVAKLMDNLSSSATFSLGLIDNTLWLISDEKNYSMSFFDELGPPEALVLEDLRSCINKLASKNLPWDIESLKDQLRRDGPVDLIAHWDNVVFSDRVWTTQAFRKKVEKEANGQGLKANYTMHHHPSLELFGVQMGGFPSTASPQDFRKQLAFSGKDLLYMKSHEIEWFEIRSLGTPENPSAVQSVSSEFYNMQDIDSLIMEIHPFTEAAVKEDPWGRDPETTYELIRAFLPIAEKLSQMGYHLNAVLEYLIGFYHIVPASHFHGISPDLYFSLQEIAWYHAASDDNALVLAQWRKITLDLLKLHEQLKTVELSFYARRASMNPNIAAQVKKFLAENQLEELWSQTDIGLVQEGAPKLRAFLTELGHLTAAQPAGGTLDVDRLTGIAA